MVIIIIIIINIGISNAMNFSTNFSHNKPNENTYKCVYINRSICHDLSSYKKERVELKLINYFMSKV